MCCAGCHRRRGRHRRGGGEGAPRGQCVDLCSDADSDVANADDVDSDNVGTEHLDDGHIAAGHDTHHTGSFQFPSIDSAPHDDNAASHDHHHVATHDDDNAAGRHLGRDEAMSTALVAEVHTSTIERSFRALGTTATVVVTTPSRADEAERILRVEVEAIDRACSRFRADSDLAQLHASAGRTVEVSPLLFEALDVAYSVAEMTNGAVDPTVGHTIEALGYDRDFEQIQSRPIRSADISPVPGFRHLHLDRTHRTARIPKGVHLDLGSSAKALLADRAAARVAGEIGSGALVSIGGDVAVAGTPPPEGWAIGIAVDSSTEADAVDQVVAIQHGGLASSSTLVRTWRMGNAQVHHIVDPATGRSSTPYWSLVSAAGASCVDANALSTAAVVWGDQALERLRPFGQAVRLLRHDGEVFCLGGWPGSERS